MVSKDKFIDSVLSFLNEDEESEEKLNKSTVDKPTSMQIGTDMTKMCAFCYKNGEIPQVYMSHMLKNGKGATICPILRKLVCVLCGASGDNAHTKKYCPLYIPENPSWDVTWPKFKRLSNGQLVRNEKQ